MYPLIKTGGLADVMGALPYALQNRGEDVRVLIPCYPAVARALSHTHVVCVRETFAGTVTLRYAEYGELHLYLLDAPQLYAREGNPYHDSHYSDYLDNYKRFALLGFIGAQLAEGLDPWWGQADILHAHDWQGGLACAYLKHWQSPVKSVFTIHNITYPGRFQAGHLAEIGLPWSAYTAEGLEFCGEISYLKAGIYYADDITTVSPSYAREITEAAYGGGLHGLLATRSAEGRVHGILNGVDHQIWNPALDVNIAKPYTLATLSKGKAENKRALQKAYGLPTDPEALLMVMVTRLTAQKGADLVLEVMDELAEYGVQFAILGSGDPDLQQAFKDKAARHPRHIGVHIGYDEALAHRIMAGGDVILVPSRFEPCGLTQLYGLKYGTLPLVRHTGGLADSVTDSTTDNIDAHTATGFVFARADAADLLEACERAMALWAKPEIWAKLRENAMGEDFGWARAASEYQKLYQTLINR